jgi:hypothetical protein
MIYQSKMQDIALTARPHADLLDAWGNRHV